MKQWGTHGRKGTPSHFVPQMHLQCLQNHIQIATNKVSIVGQAKTIFPFEKKKKDYFLREFVFHTYKLKETRLENNKLKKFFSYPLKLR